MERYGAKGFPEKFRRVTSEGLLMGHRPRTLNPVAPGKGLFFIRPLARALDHLPLKPELTQDESCGCGQGVLIAPAENPFFPAEVAVCSGARSKTIVAPIRTPALSTVKLHHPSPSSWPL